MGVVWFLLATQRLWGLYGIYSNYNWDYRYNDAFGNTFVAPTTYSDLVADALFNRALIAFGVVYFH